MVSDTGRAAQMGGFLTMKFRTYGSVFNPILVGGGKFAPPSRFF